MVLFGKKKVRNEVVKKELPQLPRLPKLPELPRLNESTSKLPALPKNSFGGERGEEVFDEKKFGQAENKVRTIQKPPKRLPEEIPKKPEEIIGKVKESGPIFIRLDKFEESLKVFEKAKDKIKEVEKMLGDTKRIKEEEEKELEEWEKEINMIKEGLENIDKNIFSKVE